MNKQKENGNSNIENTRTAEEYSATQLRLVLLDLVVRIYQISACHGIKSLDKRNMADYFLYFSGNKKSEIMLVSPNVYFCQNNSPKLKYVLSNNILGPRNSEDILI